MVCEERCKLSTVFVDNYVKKSQFLASNIDRARIVGTEQQIEQFLSDCLIKQARNAIRAMGHSPSVDELAFAVYAVSSCVREYDWSNGAIQNFIFTSCSKQQKMCPSVRKRRRESLKVLEEMVLTMIDARLRIISKPFGKESQE